MRRGVLAVATASVVATSACGGPGPGSSAPKGRSLFFIAFQRDPRTGFIKIQESLASDAMNEYVQHVGSGIFACPPGVKENGYWGETLFA